MIEALQLQLVSDTIVDRVDALMIGLRMKWLQHGSVSRPVYICLTYELAGTRFVPEPEHMNLWS